MELMREIFEVFENARILFNEYYNAKMFKNEEYTNEELKEIKKLIENIIIESSNILANVQGVE